MIHFHYCCFIIKGILCVCGFAAASGGGDGNVLDSYSFVLDTSVQIVLALNITFIYFTFYVVFLVVVVVNVFVLVIVVDIHPCV